MAGGITGICVKYYGANQLHNFMAQMHHQCARKVVSNGLGLVNFAFRLVHSVICLPNGQPSKGFFCVWKILAEIHITD